MGQLDNDLKHLHPVVRDRVERVQGKLTAEGMPFRFFEGFRSPQRQQYLWEQGRTRPGEVVTKALPWQSLHQYGLAADFVLWENNQWSWDESGLKGAWWDRLQELGRDEGLETLSWDRPHLQIRGVRVSDLQAGIYPSAGDESWAEIVGSAIYSWTGMPPAPPLPAEIPQRPSLPIEARVTPPPLDAPRVGSEGWHRRFGGQEWRYDESGLYLHDDPSTPLRTDGEPLTCRSIWSLFAEDIMAASRRYGIPISLIMMTIATETGFARRYNFSGPSTFRWEPAVKVDDVSPPIWGDYSAGPMQTLASTARWVIREQRLDYDPFTVAPVFEYRPEPPNNHPLYDSAVNIDLGSAEIRQRWSKTGADPILVAAAYNAGGLYKSADSPWGLRAHGDHLDRAGQWYGDACAVLKEMTT